jgi:AraC-like DNA-binding protein
MKEAIFQSREPVFYRSTQIQVTPTPHFHNDIELIYAEKGEFTAHVDHNVVEVKQGQMLISFPYQIHYYENCVPGVYRVILITPELLYGLTTQLRGQRPTECVIDVEGESEIHSYLSSIFAAVGENRRTVVAGYCHLLAVALLAQIRTEAAPHSEDATLRYVMEYCEDHYAEELSLGEVAEQVHLSKYYISRLFNQKLKLSFSDYLNMLRVRRATRLLEKTDKKIADISEDVGFGSIRSFNRAFLDIMKMTPIAFRQQCQVRNF